ncbi:hypothetical protein [Treponema pectinovorum]|uniref:hypothetical protein n=1 Tax=Treponema pectinovorum TaxID=164 RepID=UPI0011CC3B0E|nr:hypothetical protein [Treponema pectinovorum]
MLSEKNKKVLIKSTIIFFSFIAVCSILLILNFVSKGFWQESLKNYVEITLEKKYGSEWTLGRSVDSKNILLSDIQIFECKRSRADRTKYFALIMRTPSQAGPLPSVFICQRDECEFAGYAIENAKLTRVLERQHLSSHLVYWQTKLPQILNRAGLFDE